MRFEVTEKKSENEYAAKKMEVSEYAFMDVKTKPKMSSVLEESDMNT